MGLKYLQNKKTEKIKCWAYGGLENPNLGKYKLVEGELPESYAMEEDINIQDIINQMREAYLEQPLEYRAEIAGIANDCITALGHGDFELAKYLIEKAKIPSSLKSLKEKMLEV